MKKSILLLAFSLVVLLMIGGDLSAQTKSTIRVEAMTPHRLEVMGFETAGGAGNVTSGLTMVGKGTWVYFSAWNVSGDTGFYPGSSYLWTLVSKPSNSAAALDSTTTQWNSLHTDSAGTYTVKATVDGKDTTLEIIAANYIGADKDNVSGGTAFTCATCHVFAKPETFSSWKESGHAKMFENGMNNAFGSHWGKDCWTCHTVGYDEFAQNGGFDDVAQAVGFVDTQWTDWRTGLYDSLLTTNKAGLSMVAGIGCESCHGPKNPGHWAVGTQPKTMNAGVCAQCHDEPWRHNIYSMWSNSVHADAVWESGFSSTTATAPITNFTLSVCVRCHDGGAFVNFTKGESFDNRVSSGYNQYTKSALTCQTCHEPHSATLRVAPAAGDTLANGYNYSAVNFGNGKICVNCHKYRRGPETGVTQSATSFRGPHHRGAADVYLGMNGYTFGETIPSSIAHRLVENACVGCHMSATADTGSVARDKIGGHTWNQAYIGPDSVEYNNVTKCVECHTGITSFEDIIAASDYDVDGTPEPFMDEVDGLLERIAMALPPYGVDSISGALIAADPDSVRLKQIYWNYLYVSEDNSHGVHNPKYVIGLLQTSLRQVTDIDFSGNEPIPTEYVLMQNYPNPFNPTTTIKVGLTMSSKAVLTIYNVLGERVATLMDGDYAPGVYDVSWDGKDQSGRALAGGIYIYRLQTPEFTSIKKMVFLK